MFRSRFLAALLSASFAVQLLLAGVGSTCLQASGVASTASAADMVGMDMSTPADADHSARGAAPCGQTATPSTCQIFSACATGFLSIAATVQERESEVALAVLASNIDTPASRSVAPELPPPRA